MNLEQVEGQMAEYEGKSVGVAIPIHGSIVQMIFGTLTIVHNWTEHIILYEIHLQPDFAVSFQAQDIHKIVNAPNENLAATIYLKRDEHDSEKPRLDHV